MSHHASSQARHGRGTGRHGGEWQAEQRPENRSRLDGTPDRAPLPEIRLSTSNWTVGHWLIRDSEDGDHLDLNAPYQRDSVWTDEQREGLIKSLYMGIPVGAVTVSKLPYDPQRPAVNYRVVDGKQRIETVRAWMNDELEVPGWWFRPGDIDDPRPERVRYSNLAVATRRRFEMTVPLPSVDFDGTTEYLSRGKEGEGWITRDRTPEELLAAEAQLYLLLNSAGTSQTKADLDRAAVIAGRRTS